MKMRRKLRVWQMLPMAVLLVLILVSFFLPMLHIDPDDKIYEELKIQPALEQLVEYSDDTSLSAWDIMTFSLKEKLDSALEKAGKELDEKLDFEGSEVLGMALEMLGLNDTYRGLTDYMQGWVTPIQIPLQIVFVGNIVLLLLLIVNYFTGITKFISAILSTVFGVAFSILSGVVIFGMPGIIMDKSEQLFKKIVEATIAYSKVNMPDDFSLPGAVTDQVEEELAKVSDQLGSLWSSLLDVGIYLLFIVCILLAVMGIVTLLTANRPVAAGRRSGIAAGDEHYFGGWNLGAPYDFDVLPGTNAAQGSMLCENGDLAGALIPVTGEGIVVGCDAALSQVVLNGFGIADRHFSILYDISSGYYVITCLTEFGTEIYGEQFGRQVMTMGTRWSIPPGTKVILGSGSAVFTLS